MTDVRDYLSTGTTSAARASRWTATEERARPGSIAAPLSP